MDFENVQIMLKNKEIENIRELIDLTDEELENIIINMNVEKRPMLEYLGNLKGDEKILKIIQAFAEKYCRCIDNIKDPSYNKYAVAICTKQIFNSRGLKGLGSNFQCKPIPMLYPDANRRIIKKKL